MKLIEVGTDGSFFILSRFDFPPGGLIEGGGGLLTKLNFYMGAYSRGGGLFEGGG